MSRFFTNLFLIKFWFKKDQYERCAANAAGRSFIIPNPEFAQRETEREARR